jgi:hypothetical protein
MVVTCREDDADVRTSRLYQRSQLRPLHVRKAHIRKENIDGIMLLEQGKSCLRAGCFDRRMSQRIEHIDCCHADKRIVLDHQDSQMR